MSLDTLIGLLSMGSLGAIVFLGFLGSSLTQRRLFLDDGHRDRSPVLTGQQPIHNRPRY